MLMTRVREKLNHLALEMQPTSVAPFRRILPDELIIGWLKEHGHSWRDRIYTPLIVFWAMVVQALDEDHSCSGAVGNVRHWLAGRKAPGQSPKSRRNKPSPITGSYCRARARLPLELFMAMARRVGQQLHGLVPPENRLWGRDIYLVDATTVSMPDTPELGEEFGKHYGGTNRSEFPFPIARLVALVSLTSGAVVDMAMGAYKSSEHMLLQKICKGADWLRGAIIVGDSLYGAYAQVAQLKGRGVDIISRPVATRDIDMRRGKRLGQGQRLVTWKRPKKHPAWLEDGQQLPDTLELRLIEVTSLRRGHRPKRLILVTTLLDPDAYPAEEIAQLYLRRWEIEIDFRNLKSVLGIEVLGGKTPDIVKKEIWSAILGYNLVRRVMWEAGVSHDFPPSGLEFQRDAPLAALIAAPDRDGGKFKFGFADLENSA